MKRLQTKQIKADPNLVGKEVLVAGWVKTVRKQSTFSFVELNDGSQVSNLQVVIESTLKDYEIIMEKIQTGAAIRVIGTVSSSPGKGQSVEIKPSHVEVVGEAPADYPLQKKRHSFEYLRTIAHLRPRTNTMGAVMRVRSRLAFATHEFFQKRGFQYIQTPIITSLDCEGAGELFHVDTPKDPFFGRQAYLTVSGQLNVEAFAAALNDVYTFGPTFRAENSNTSRHLAEFWMIEPEISFANLEDDMNLASSYLKHLVVDVLDHCQEDLAFFHQFIDPTLFDRLQFVINKPCARISYTDAIKILQESGQDFAFPCSWGLDLQSEHERFLAEKYFKGPVILYNYPAAIKAFYMRMNDDQKTVAAMDLLVPGIGELIGGSQREERYDVLLKKMEDSHLKIEDYQWYLELRKFGSTPHAGFGLGFERLVQYVTGMENIRDVIAYPRYPGHCAY
jgi:asparaginyl-tRNA synthetase